MVARNFQSAVLAPSEQSTVTILREIRPHFSTLPQHLCLTVLYTSPNRFKVDAKAFQRLASLGETRFPVADVYHAPVAYTGQALRRPRSGCK